MAWIRPLAEPYLRGYDAVVQRSGSLRGYWFISPVGKRRRKRGGEGARSRGAVAGRGFFVGYLVRGDDFSFLAPEPPECLVFAFVAPVGREPHRRLVSQPGGLLRITAEYVRWLTHRPPRFAFFGDTLPALVRHQSMRGWPRGAYGHLSRNFFIETLAWLVRSGLARKLRGEEQPA